MSGALGIYCCFFDSHLAADPVRHKSTSWLVASSVACGFFTWDLYICLANYEIYGWQFVLHAAFCLATYLTCGYSEDFPFAWHAASFLLFELSTPLLHIRWALIEFKLGSTAITICTYLFGLVFFLCRIVWGNFYAFPLVWGTLIWRRPAGLPLWQMGAFWCFSFLSAALNSFWMYKLYQSATKRRDKKKKAE